MNALDIMLLVIIGISGLMSFRVGLIREAFALGALLIGLFAAVVLGRTFADRLPDVTGNEVATQVLFFFLCFLVVYLVVILLGAMIAKLTKTVHMRWFDHLLGFVFGSVRGAILGMLILAVLTLILPEENVLLARSRGYQAASGPLRVLAHLLPEKAEEAFHRRHEIYRQLVPEKRKKDEKTDDKPPFGKGIPLRL